VESPGPNLTTVGLTDIHKEHLMKVLITGSNSGFGLLSAIGFARAGHDVVATMRNPAKGDALRAAADGLPIEIRQLDVTDAASVTAAIADPLELDVVVNNAGFEVQSAMELVDDELLARQLDTNVRGPMRVMRAVLPAWRERGSGVVVNVSSITGVVVVPYGGAYSASKHALEAMTEALHYEMAPFGLRFALIEPGRFDTEFHSNIVSPSGWEQSVYHERHVRFREALTALDSGDAPADPQDVADAIIAAATDPTTPLRTLVGDDAQLIAAVRAQGDFEQFEATMRTTLNWFD
jgi:NAD(P)-dependent dehydrogenase (short-subunit alcohol dehydrogenase family)